MVSYSLYFPFSYKEGLLFMKKVALVLAMIMGPTISMAGDKLVAVQEINIPAGVDSLLIDAKGACVFKIEAAEFARVISKDSSFDIENVQLLPKSWLSAEDIRSFIFRNYGVSIDLEKKMTSEELNEFIKINYGIEINDSEYYSQVLTVASRASGSSYTLICQTKKNHTKNSILFYLFENGLLKPSREI